MADADNPSATLTYTYAADRAWGKLRAPDGTIVKHLFGTTTWQAGLPLGAEYYAADNESVKKKWTPTLWENAGVSTTFYDWPRVTDEIVQDEAGNKRWTSYDYGSNSYNLLGDASEYTASGGGSYQLQRRTHQTYLNYVQNTTSGTRRLIGLVTERDLYDAAGVVAAKTTFGYDATGPNLVQQMPPSGQITQHDTVNYGTSRTWRGNLTSATRWDASAPSDASLAVTTTTGYNTTGNPIFQVDPLFHRSDIGYVDDFSDQPTINSTRAYPTTLTDPDGFQSKLHDRFWAITVARTGCSTAAWGSTRIAAKPASFSHFKELVRHDAGEEVGLHEDEQAD